MKQFRHIFWFHFQESVLSKAAIIMGVAMFAIVVGAFGIGHWRSQGEVEVRVIIIEETPLFTLEGVFTEFMDASELDKATEYVEAGDANHVLIVGEEFGVPTLTNIFRNDPHFESLALATATLQQQYLELVMASEDISAEVASRLLLPIEITDAPLRDMEEFFQAFVLVYAFGFALMMILVTFGQSIAMSVVSEKSTRVMEVMISKVSPVSMMFAKVLAVFATVLVVILQAGSGALVAYLLGWLDPEHISIFGLPLDLTILNAEILVVGLSFIVLGYFLYGMIYATIGAICSKVETLTSISGPLQILIMIPFFITMFMQEESFIRTVASYLPFFSPFVMFDRFVSGEAVMLEVILSKGLLVLTIMGVAYFATRIYVNGVMHYSEKVSWKELKKLMIKS